MLTLISYLALEHFQGNNWSGWLLFLPVMLDITLIEKL